MNTSHVIGYCYIKPIISSLSLLFSPQKKQKRKSPTSPGESAGGGNPPSCTLYSLTRAHVTASACTPGGSSPMLSSPTPPTSTVSRWRLMVNCGVMRPLVATRRLRRGAVVVKEEKRALVNVDEAGGEGEGEDCRGEIVLVFGLGFRSE